MTTTTHTNASTSRAFKFPALPNSRSYPRRSAPSIRRVTVDGSRCLAVGLSGKMGDGWECLVDASTWEELRGIAGERWYLVGGSDVARSYVATGTVAARNAAGTAGSVALVSRVILGRDENLDGKSVVHLNGMRLDLRAANLRVLTKAEAGVYRPERPLPVVSEGWSE
jgi:hypothetical protein